MKAKSIKNIERELNAIDPKEMIEVNLKQLLTIYKAVEDWRKFFHNSTHYPTVDDVNRYVGNRKHGMYAAMNHIYIKTFEIMLPPGIDDRLE
jgi:hypothetical protein